MGLGKKVMECVVLSILLIASLVSVRNIKNAPTSSTMNDDPGEVTMARYRLPNNAIPRLYDIYIEPNMEDDFLSWTGKISIDIEIVDPTRVLTLHAFENLNIYESLTELVDTDGSKFSPVKHNRDARLEFLNLHFDHEIPVGNYSLRLKYKGTETRNIIGFYNASYKLEDKQLGHGHVVGTHFEATTARRAFPCWDEPGLKARFHVSIKHSPHYTAISNMPESKQFDTADGKIVTVFKTTPFMSTYHLTFVISDFKNVFNKHGNVSVHAAPRVIDDVTHLMDFSIKAVEVMEAYTGFSHGVPRLGSVVLPRYSSAATEHWGLVSYKEMWIKRKQNRTTIDENDRIDMLIAHELAHSWFGNRVTPRWWGDLWLNEGFAAYFQYYIVDQIYDNWRGLDLFVVSNNQELAFILDGDRGIPDFPVKWIPITNEQIRLVFNRYTYKKGAAIVHMFRNILGDNVFRAGIQKYIAKHSFQSADADDLMAAFQEAYEVDPTSEKPLSVKETMTSWLTQIGYPLINVTRNYTTGDTIVSQISSIPNAMSTKWWVPLTYTTKSSLNFSSTLPNCWMSDKQESVNINGIDKNDWIILNIQASGFYRVNYDEENWRRLAEYLNTDDYKNIHVLNRVRLINDAYYLADRQPNEYLPIFYKLTKYLTKEVEYLPWRSAYPAFRSIERSLHGTDLHNIFVNHVVGLLHSFVEKVGFEVKDTDDHFTKLARIDILPWACELGHKGCSNYAAQKLLKLQENPSKNRSYPAGSEWIFCAGLRGLNATAAQLIFNRATEDEETMLLANVDCTENHELLGNILIAALDTDYTLEKDNAYRIFSKLLGSTEENFNFAVDFFIENHQAMHNEDTSIEQDESDSGLNCDAAKVELVVQIFCAVSTRARLEKFKQVLLLDGVMKDPKMLKTMIERAERTIVNTEARIAPFLKVWEELTTTENFINGSRKNSR